MKFEDISTYVTPQIVSLKYYNSTDLIVRFRTSGHMQGVHHNTISLEDLIFDYVDILHRHECPHENDIIEELTFYEKIDGAAGGRANPIELKTSDRYTFGALIEQLAGLIEIARQKTAGKI